MNAYVPVTGWPSAATTRHDTVYAPAGSAVTAWLTTSPATDAAPDSKRACAASSTATWANSACTGWVNVSSTVAGAASSVTSAAGLDDLSSVCAAAVAGMPTHTGAEADEQDGASRRRFNTRTPSKRDG